MIWATNHKLSTMNPLQNYFLALNGKTYGPYPASQFAEMMANGTINYNALVCLEGSDQWKPVGTCTQELGLPAPQPRVVSTPLSARQTEPETPPPHARGKGREPLQLKGLRIATLLGALGLFFLPWLELQCSGKSMLYQSGYHTIVCASAPSPEMAKLGETMGAPSGASMDETKLKEATEDTETAWLVGVCALLILVALCLCFSKAVVISGLAAMLATLALGVQLLIGFPLETKMEKEFEKESSSKEAAASTNPMSSLLNMIKGASDAKSAAPEPAAVRSEMEKSMMPKIVYHPWLWAEFALLGLFVILSFLNIKV